MGGGHPAPPHPFILQICVPSYIKDTDDFLKTVLDTNTIIPPNSILVTLDVRSLSTNIPQDEGTRICLTALGNFYENRLPLPLGHLRQMFDFILKYNYFGLDDKFYLQIHGTAMGTTFAPNYSNIFMGDLNTKHCKMHQTIYNHSFGNASLMTYS